MSHFFKILEHTVPWNIPDLKYMKCDLKKKLCKKYKEKTSIVCLSLFFFLPWTFRLCFLQIWMFLELFEVHLVPNQVGGRTHSRNVVFQEKTRSNEHIQYDLWHILTKNTYIQSPIFAIHVGQQKKRIYLFWRSNF